LGPAGSKVGLVTVAFKFPPTCHREGDKAGEEMECKLWIMILLRYIDGD
jgi:hypothetical protein